VIVFHGLAANQRLMKYLGDYLALAGWRVYLLDLPGHGANTDAFTFGRAFECAAETVEALVKSRKVDPARTVLVGHSMGGSIALRIADREPVAATIAISPGPTPPPKRMPSNLLVFSAQFDPPQLRREAFSLDRAAGGERVGPEDFVQRRAFELRTIPKATHTSVLHDPDLIEESVRWIVSTLHADTAPQQQAASLSAYWEMVRENPPTRNLLGSISGALGMLALFPFVATFVSSALRAGDLGEAEPAAAGAPGVRLALAEGAVCALAAILLVTIGVPLKFLHLYSGDYLASVLVIAGVLFLLLNWRAARGVLAIAKAGRPVLAATVLGFGTLIAVSAWLNWQITDLWLNAPRWLRFAELLPLAFAFCWGEEVALGPVAAGRKRAWRFCLSLLLRLEIWLACALAYYALGSGQVLVLLLVVYLGFFSILQRLAVDAFRKRTGSAAGSAWFDAILAAWFIAAVFPLA